MRPAGPSDGAQRLHAAAARAREKLREACRRGDRAACALLRELGELAAPPHWTERDEDEDVAGGGADS